MNDELLSALRREPPPDFAARLKASLQATDVTEHAERRHWPLGRIAASLAVVAITGSLLTVPAVRASARSFLAKFRVVNFVAIEVDERRVAELRSEGLDLPDMLGEHVQILQDPGPPVAAVSPEQAGAAAGIDVRLPAWLPPSVELTGIQVKGPGRLQVTANTSRLEQLMDFLGINDLEVPSGLDGKVAQVHVPSIVAINYQVSGLGDRGARARFLQAQSPEIDLPDGIDLATLAEIGLRVLGLAPEEARQFARTVDWRTTLLLPVPPGTTSFKHVEINGQPGIAMERAITVENSGDEPGAAAILSDRGTTVQTVRYERMLLWSAGGRVFGFEGNFSTESFLKMAYSVR